MLSNLECTIMFLIIGMYLNRLRLMFMTLHTCILLMLSNLEYKEGFI